MKSKGKSCVLAYVADAADEVRASCRCETSAESQPPMNPLILSLLEPTVGLNQYTLVKQVKVYCVLLCATCDGASKQ